MKKCCICKNPIDGYGNNAHPFARGTCCDACNAKWVIPYRLRLQQQQHIRITADNLITQGPAAIQKHGSAWLNKYVGKRVAITMYDDSVEYGVLHVDTVAIRYMTWLDGDNKTIHGYYIDRAQRGELHFQKSHVKAIELWEGGGNV